MKWLHVILMALSIVEWSFSIVETILPDKHFMEVDLNNGCRCLNGTVHQHHDATNECRCTGWNFLDIPANLSSELEKLIVEDAGLVILKSDSLQPYSDSLRDLTLINLEYLKRIEPGIFDNLNYLDTVYIHRAPNLIHIEDGVFNVYIPMLKTLRIVHTGLVFFPNLTGLGTKSVFPTILLNFNSITTIEKEAFHGSHIAKLSLKGNLYLKQLHSLAFSGLESLRIIDLSSTAITQLPTVGLEEIEILKIEDTTALTIFPSVYNFKNIQIAWLTYPSHCCAFRFPRSHNPWEYTKHKHLMQHMHDSCKHNTTVKSTKPMLRSLLEWLPLNSTPYSSADSESFWTNDDEVFGVAVDARTPVTAYCGKISKNYKQVICYPTPDAFNPCEDLMGNWALRLPVWFISLSAIIGNLLVLIVIITSRFRLTVSKFLMANLAMADLSIGMHLILIAIVDACSVGLYFNYAIHWQGGNGCKIGGFLTVFGNILSVYTLTVITTERWYTITWAIHLNKRLKLNTAVRVMICGWLCAIFMASLPLMGVSNYSKTSICLPLKMHNKADVIYLSTLLAFNAFAFALICACYGNMYKSITKGNQCATVTSVRSDLTVAKRMALLVFTDFACWAPIAFFGLTAILGYPLITVYQTKILLVFFYPLNSCANPCLYALLTQQYRRDFFILLGRCGLCKNLAEQHKGAIGGMPLPYGSGPQYKRANSATDGFNVKQASGNNYNYPGPSDHRGSVLTTLVSVEMPVFNSNSRPNSRPNSLKVVPELCVKSTADNNFDVIENECHNKYLSSGNL